MRTCSVVMCEELFFRLFPHLFVKKINRLSENENKHSSQPLFDISPSIEIGLGIVGGFPLLRYSSF